MIKHAQGEKIKRQGNEEALKSDAKASTVDEEALKDNEKVLKGNEDALQCDWVLH